MVFTMGKTVLVIIRKVTENRILEKGAAYAGCAA